MFGICHGTVEWVVKNFRETGLMFRGFGAVILVWGRVCCVVGDGLWVWWFGWGVCHIEVMGVWSVGGVVLWSISSW